MTIEDYDSVIGLLTATSGVRLREADSREATARYLERNPGLSFVALVDGVIAGCVMCGHDGRRGYLQHLAVSPRFRERGIGSAPHQTRRKTSRCLRGPLRICAKQPVSIRYETDDMAGWRQTGRAMPG